jgi:V/A-type H+-transporting ATPase subunit I
MSWREAALPEPMARVALVAPVESVRDLLVRVADAGVVQVDSVTGDEAGQGEAARRLQRVPAAEPVRPLLSPAEPDLDELEQAGRADLLAGEAQLEGYRSAAVRRGGVSALAGWTPAAAVPDLAGRLAGVGGAVVRLPVPAGAEPPTLLRRRSGAALSFGPLVETYSTVPYRDVDPTVLAGLAYVVMFGMMFGDLGDGLLLVAAGLLVRSGWPRRWPGLRARWQLLTGAGLAASLFGLAYGEAFGPTGLVPALWLAPLDRPLPLLSAAIGLGALLLAGAYAVGTVNRVREGGWALAGYAPAGLAGATVFLGAGLAAAGWYLAAGWLAVSGGVVALGGLALSFAGLHAAAGPGAAGWLQAAVELFDTMLRLGANVVSFARLAAFGITHAAIGDIVWRGTTGLWHDGPAAMAAAVVLFAAGHAAAFGLEALVAGVQALRLEYYELFSRVFVAEGRPFRPWRVPTAPSKEES